MYSLVANAIPKYAAWAKKDPEIKAKFCSQVGKWVTDNIIQVNTIIEKKSNDLEENILYQCLPHLSARILHSLSEEHSDLIDPDLVVRLLWAYKRLQLVLSQQTIKLFLDYYFKKQQSLPGIPAMKEIEFKPKYRDIFFPTDFGIKYEISDHHNSQVTILYSIKLAAVKVHEFEISILEDYLKLLDSIIIPDCQNEEFSMLIYTICECLLKSPQPNSLNVKIDLSLSKKGWLACCILKKAVVDTKKNKEKMEDIITDMLSTHKFNNIPEMMNCYEYALFFFTKPENKKKIQKAFENCFGSSLFTKLRLIFEKLEDQPEAYNKGSPQINKMNLPPILMRKIFDAIMSHFDGSFL